MDKQSSDSAVFTQKVTIHDCRKAGFCVSGVKTACNSLGLDFKTLVREGLPLEEIELIEDVNVQRAVQVAKERISG